MITGNSIGDSGALTDEEKRALLFVARRALTHAVTMGGRPNLDTSNLPQGLLAPGCCFVTLTNQGRLRGCIGNLAADGPLWDAAVRNACSAASRDTRFPPVTPEELEEIAIEVSVLSPAEPLAFDSPEDLLAKLKPHTDGVILQIANRCAVYLPQVWEKLPDKELFLDSLAVKAGCAPAAWRDPANASISVFRVESFSEAS
jgi:AmmeMemoRadiSam system protein A